MCILLSISLLFNYRYMDEYIFVEYIYFSQWLTRKNLFIE